MRSTRESNFDFYLLSLSSLITLYQYNYARCASVYLYDLMNIETNISDLFRNFKQGHFALQKSRKEFLNIALDQVHEKNNTVLKGVGVVVHFSNKQDETLHCVGKR